MANVLSYYFKVTHDVVDKYELARGIINEDVVSFTTSKRYDQIIFISTLEHIGYDEEEKEPREILRAIDNLQSLLTDGGRLVFTIPYSYNPSLGDDDYRQSNPFQKGCLLGEDNQRQLLEAS